MPNQDTDQATPSTESSTAVLTPAEYDFKNPRRIQPEQKETLRVIHETYVNALSITLSSFLRTDVKISLQSTEQQTFAEYVRSLNTPTCIGIFDMHLLNGYGLLEVNSALVYSVVDRTLGGKGSVNKTMRPFTSVETTISRKLLEILLKELSIAWDYLVKISFELKDVQTNPAFVRITPEREICIITTMKVQIGEVSGLITLCLPYSNLEPIAPKLVNQQSPYTITQTPEVKESLRNAIGNIEVDLNAILGSIELSMEDLLSLETGDILNLGHKAKHPITLRVAGQDKFKVIPGLLGKFKGVSIEKEITKE
ncbi:MAG: fliM [Chlamydiales bacterium]|jgi:flagellar motor switch protein FliM|nr:fliM [Chlamydiales bacterium]